MISKSFLDNGFKIMLFLIPYPKSSITDQMKRRQHESV
jgi:hypothetical protein